MKKLVRNLLLASSKIDNVLKHNIYVIFNVRITTKKECKCMKTKIDSLFFVCKIKDINKLFVFTCAAHEKECFFFKNHKKKHWIFS